ncbi:outer membrane lipoprotein-sorting protein [Dyadobacter sp. 676]|uniref:Outer membrane lipoprotein-sorting protein n=1 Tax=Dyadobacter sp. 676 TaxID=3088362 RepID=A0AAU8FPN1_9BACT
MKITAEMDIMNMKVPITTTIVQNKGFRSESTVQGMTVVQAVNGDKGWSINPATGNTKPTALPEDAVKSMANETDLTGLYNYKEKGYKLTLDGEEDLAGAKVYKVTMILPNGVRRINYISKDTFYILKIVAQTKMNGQDVMSENIQSDFRAVDGIYYPFMSEVTTSAMPGTKMGLRITSLEVNPKIDPKIFEMPQ